jgi:hypothetical protein
MVASATPHGESATSYGCVWRMPAIAKHAIGRGARRAVMIAASVINVEGAARAKKKDPGRKTRDPFTFSGADSNSSGDVCVRQRIQAVRLPPASSSPAQARVR